MISKFKSSAFLGILTPILALSVVTPANALTNVVVGPFNHFGPVAFDNFGTSQAIGYARLFNASASGSPGGTGAQIFARSMTGNGYFDQINVTCSRGDVHNTASGVQGAGFTAFATNCLPGSNPTSGNGTLQAWF